MTPVEVAPGVLRLRFPLPYRLDHVNVYLIEDQEGWVILDTGLNDALTRQLWKSVITQSLRGMPISRIILSHCHPDHMGLAGWLSDRCSAPIYMTQTEYLIGRTTQLAPHALDTAGSRKFYVYNGLDDETIDAIAARGFVYKSETFPLPQSYRRLMSGDTLTIGRRSFSILTGGGHASEQAMLYCAAEEILFVGDQVINHITPNVSVWEDEPEGDPLGLYLKSLADLKSKLPRLVHTLPGHGEPFMDLHRRIDELTDHHWERCILLENACRERPRSVAELIPILFPRPLDVGNRGFAFGEVLAHANLLVREGRADWSDDQAGTRLLNAGNGVGAHLRASQSLS